MGYPPLRHVEWVGTRFLHTIDCALRVGPLWAIVHRWCHRDSDYSLWDVSVFVVGLITNKQRAPRLKTFGAGVIPLNSMSLLFKVVFRGHFETSFGICTQVTRRKMNLYANAASEPLQNQRLRL